MSFEDKITLLLEEAVEEADRLEFTDDSARYCSFIQYVAQFTEHLTERAMAEAIVSFSPISNLAPLPDSNLNLDDAQVNSEHGLHSSLVMLLDAWQIWLRGKWKDFVAEEQQPAIGWLLCSISGLSRSEIVQKWSFTVARMRISNPK